MPISQKLSKTVLTLDVFHFASKTYSWINFPSKIPTVEQLFCRTARLGAPDTARYKTPQNG